MLRHYHITLLLLLTMIMGACSDSLELPETPLVPGSPGTLTIQFQNSSLTRNQASDDSENRIQNLAVGLYNFTASEDEEPVKFVTISTIPNAIGDYTFTVSLDEETVTALFNDRDGENCKIFAVANLTADQINELSSLEDKPTISQLKNIPISADFRNTALQQSFVMAGVGEVTYKAPTGGQKLGSAAGSASLVRAAAKIRLNISLPEYINVGTEENPIIWEPVPASGIFALLNNGVRESIVAPEQTIDTSEETPTIIPWKPADPTTAYYNSTLRPGSQRELKKDNSVTGEFSYVMDVPFYTFPNTWTESPDEDHKTSLTLTVAWSKRGEQEWQTFFYQLPVTPISAETTPQIVRNHSYTVNMRVSMLGSPTEEEPIEVDNLTYEIVPWGQKDVDVDIQDFRYLVVDPNDISIDNEEEINIPFYSSHPVDVSNLTMTFQRFNYFSDNDGNGNGEVVEIKVNKTIIDRSTWTHEVKENGVTKSVIDTICTAHAYKDAKNQWYLKIKHPMALWTAHKEDNDIITFTGNGTTDAEDKLGDKALLASDLDVYKFTHTDEQPYSPYVFTLTLSHSDNAAYSQSVKITQYPGMYIKAVRNPGTGTKTDSGGNVYVNNGEISGLGAVASSLSGFNANPNMYVITISQLNEGSRYYIGDPRMTEINNDLSTYTTTVTPTPLGSIQTISYPDLTDASEDEAGIWCARAGFLYGTKDTGTGTPGTRRLTYYYPTMESQAKQYKMRVAPKFRVASSYGKTSTVSRDGARRRMATYQEMGCPAGRWRLPTYGELEFIISLSGTGKIPVLYSDDSYYWTAQGACLINSDGTITLEPDFTDKAYVRGVYDEWYWERYTNYTISPTNTNYTYTLGDVPRSAPIPAQ